MNPTFILVASTTAKLCRVLVEKMAKKWQNFTFFEVTRQNFLGSRWNISTNEPVLERLLNFWNFGKKFTLIAHLVRARKSPKVKKSLYQTHIVTTQMLFDCWTVINKVSFFPRRNAKWGWMAKYVNLCVERTFKKNSFWSKQKNKNWPWNRLFFKVLEFGSSVFGGDPKLSDTDLIFIGSNILTDDDFFVTYVQLIFNKVSLDI